MQHTYHYQAYATNPGGTATTTDQTLTTTACQPTVSATPGDALVNLSWSIPDDSTGLPILNYWVSYKTSVSPNWLLVSAINRGILNYSVAGLVNGESYDFQVVTETAVGSSSPGQINNIIPVATHVDPPGGGGGGGGGGYVVTDKPIEKPKTEIKILPVKPVASSTIKVPVVNPVTIVKKPIVVVKVKPLLFNKDFKVGAKNIDVTNLQKILKKEKLFSSPITNYFGKTTTQAVKAYQKKYKLKITGIVDKATRARLNK